MAVVDKICVNFIKICPKKAKTRVPLHIKDGDTWFGIHDFETGFAIHDWRVPKIVPTRDL